MAAINSAFVMTWRDESGALRMQPLAACSMAGAWCDAFNVAESKGWEPCCRFAVGRAGAKGCA